MSNKKIIPLLEDFFNDDSTNMVKHKSSKQITSEKNKLNYQKHREKRLEYAKKYQQEHKSEISEKGKRYYQENRDDILNYQKQYQQEHKEERKAYLEQYKVTNAHVIKANYNNKKDDLNFKLQRKSQQSTPQGKYVSYKSKAKQRNIPFELTLSDFQNLYQTLCEYCGEKIETIGIDRVDNTLGYTLDNIKSCCNICNKIKRNFTLEQFNSHITKILNYNNQKHIPVYCEKDKNRKYAGYRCDSISRSLEFDITKEQFDYYVTHSCEYCGSTEKIGIDRINNDIGYIEGNLASCCKICNLMKYTHTKQFFIEHINKIYNYSIKT